MSIQKNISFTRLFWTTSAAALLWSGLGLASQAHAQSQVTVDLSVLSDSGYGPATVPGYAGGSAKLLMPGSTAPKSTYFGPSVTITNPVISAPAASDTTQMTSTLSAADTVPPPAPEPMEVPAEPVIEETTTAAVSDVLTAISTESSEETATASTSAVSLEPAESDAPPPPPAPETIETETAASEAPTTETETSSESSSTEVAAATSMASGATTSGRALQIVFADDESKIPGSAGADLSPIVDQIKDSDNLRIQLLAYAGGENLSASKARRLSLSRALSVRSFFIENGVRSTRIDVRALGNRTDEQPINRVDVNIIEQ